MNQKERNNNPLIPVWLRWILPVALWVILSVCSYQFLYKVQERSYFEYDLFWLSGFLNKPSGILSCISLFLTQFLHIPWLGALIWVLLLTASAELTRITFRIPQRYALITYIPAAIFVAYNMSLGYIVYLINLPGYFFLPVLGSIWALLTVLILRKPDNPAKALLFAVVCGAVGYYVAGFYGFAGILAAIMDNMLSSKSRNTKSLLIAGAAVVMILAPILFVGTTTYNLAFGWTIGMPEPTYGIPSSRLQLSLTVAMLWIAITPLLTKLLNGLTAKHIQTAIQGVALASVIAIPASTWFRDDTFKAELDMIRAADNMEWSKAVQAFDKLQEKYANDPSWQPTRVLVVLKDLALIKTGQESERGFDFEDGSCKQKAKWNVPMSLQIGRILYLQYGIPGLCNRWCIEESVLFDWNYMTYKYLAMIAMVLDDTQLSKKYLSKLEHTIFYRKWAKEQLKICGDRETIVKTAPYDQIIPLMCFDDEVRADMDGCEFFLMDHFNGIRPENATPLYDRVALYFAMKTKQTTLFWTRFLLYLESNNPKQLGRYYQEAAYLFGNVSNNEMMDALPYDEHIKSLYKSFTQNASRYGKKSLEEARACFTKNLRHTYYFYYYYVNELQMY